VGLVKRSPDPNLDVEKGCPESAFTRFFEIEHSRQVRRPDLMFGEVAVAEDVVRDALQSSMSLTTHVEAAAGIEPAWTALQAAT
jgi:hypothetical protein